MVVFETRCSMFSLSFSFFLLPLPLIIPNIVTLNILINAYSEKGMMDKAEKLFERIIELGGEPDQVTYTALIKGYCLQDNVDRTKEILEQMNGTQRCFARSSYLPTPWSKVT